MDRMQVYVETEQRLRLAALARAKKRPAAELIREALSRYLDAETSRISETDGMFSLIGAGGEFETATDVASNHHRYLALADMTHAKYTPSKRSRSSEAKRDSKRRRSR